ncbi:hypothetical protein [Achromobacter denitrificans]|uniref:hypothetical protein n=1 Tax=Achromobacter denitrificans TaxID=32002 RepID=UPI00242C290F|nr:hypothetical protein [Achromobacter denitrificans]MBV2160221.1 hypothetical protein [Achromobacter denitrificans]
MNKAELMKRGADHCKAGKQLTPFDCRDIDAELFAEAKQQAAAATSPMARCTIQARVYRTLRAAFNNGWQIEYFASVA